MSIASEYKYYDPPYLLVPYTPELPETNSDVNLLNAYGRIKQEGLSDIVFHDNPNITLGDYVSWFNLPNVLPQFIFKVKDDMTAEDMVGMIWLSDVMKCETIARGSGSFIYFRRYMDGHTPEKLAKLVFQYWFEALNMDIVTGTTPMLNKAAIKYIRKIGMQEVGIMPQFANYKGRVSDALMSCMTRDIYDNSYGLM